MRKDSFTQTLLALSAFLLVMAVPGAAQAEASSWYVGAGLGLTLSDGYFDKLKETENTLRSMGYAAPYADQTRYTPGGFEYRVFAGYFPWKSIGFEAMYASLGTYHGEVDGENLSLNPWSVTNEQETTVKGYSFTVIGQTAITASEKTLLFGRAGVFLWDVESTFTLRTISQLPTYTDVETKETKSESGASPVIGAGFRFLSGEVFSWRLEYNYISNVGDKDTTGEADIHSLTLNGMWEF